MREPKAGVSRGGGGVGACGINNSTKGSPPSYFSLWESTEPPYKYNRKNRDRN